MTVAKSLTSTTIGKIGVRFGGFLQSAEIYKLHPGQQLNMLS